MASTGSPVPDARLAPYPANDSAEALLAAAADPGLIEALALALLSQTALPSAAIEVLVKNRAVASGRKVQRALLLHRHTPRQVWLPFVRNMATLELAVVALSPTVPAEVQRACEEAVIVRVKTISLGERKTLARRSTSRLAGALLLDVDRAVVYAALGNGRLTEAGGVQALLRPHASHAFVSTVCHHPTWSLLLAAYFFVQRQTTAFAFSLFFFFENWLYTATYMADARAMVLPLVTTGDPDFVEHDWNTIFTSLGVLPYDTTIAGVVRFGGWCGMIGTAVWLIWRVIRSTGTVSGI